MPYGGVFLLAVALLHAGQALILALYPSASRATSLLLLTDSVGSARAALVLALAASLTVLGASIGRMWWMAIPEMIVLWLGAEQAILAAAAGQYADGTVIKGAHILADQFAYIALSSLYPLALYDVAFRYYIRTRQRTND